jgi:hypothetical protein
MKRFTAFQKTVALVTTVLMLSLFINSCASMPEGRMGDYLKGAGIGAAIGAATGAITGDSDDAVKGAALGALAGLAAVWLLDYYEVRLTKSPETIENTYKETAAIQDLLIHNYDSIVVEDILRKGDEAIWTTSFDVQKPDDITKKIVETRQIEDPDGNIIKTNAYDYTEHVKQSNGYAFDLQLPVPDEAPEGFYTYSSKLEVGEGEDKYVSETKEFQIAYVDSQWKIYAQK